MKRLNVFMTLILTASLLCPSLCIAKVYQCEVNGKVVFQDHLCEVSETQKELVVVQSIASDFTDEERKLINSNEVAIGMTKKALLKSRGEPNDIHRSGRGGEQWLYQGDDGRMLQVFMKDGKVFDWKD